jgi:hypothetical protein
MEIVFKNTARSSRTERTEGFVLYLEPCRFISALKMPDCLRRAISGILHAAKMVSNTQQAMLEVRNALPEEDSCSSSR